MKLIDLTRTLDSGDLDRLPKRVRASASVIVPEVDYETPDGKGADIMCSIFACERHHLPDGQGWGSEQLRMNSHIGTHVDAPLHYGLTCEGKPARTIEQISLDELYCPALVLDLRDKIDGNEITVEMLKAALRENRGTPGEGCALLLRTGQERYTVADEGLYDYPGMTRDSTLFLGSLGARVLGTDALGWDRPFHVMRQAFRATGDASQIWDGHFAGREREVFIVQQLDNLKSVPSHGFHVGFFPIKLAHCSAAPARVVAFVP
jgi:kynurenine formamidase